MNLNASDPSKTLEKSEAEARRFELLISNLLRGGVLASLLLTSVGLIVMFAHHPEFFTSREALGPLIHPLARQPDTAAKVARGAAALQGRMLVMLGLLLLIATPVLRVAVSIASYARQRDRTYIAITSGVLALLLISFLMGRAG